MKKMLSVERRFLLLLWLPFCAAVVTAATCAMPPETRAAEERLVAARAEAMIAAKDLKEAYEAFAGDKSAENLAVLARATMRAADAAKDVAEATKEYTEAAKAFGTGGLPVWLATILTLVGVRLGGVTTAIAAPANSTLARIVTAFTGGSGFHDVGSASTSAGPPT